MTMPGISQDDVTRVKSYMLTHHCGYERAAARSIIAETLGMEDRKFRKICAAIPEIMTSSKYGYYILPLYTLDRREIEVAKEILENEDRRRMIALYLRQRKQRSAVKRLEENSLFKEKQLDFYDGENHELFPRPEDVHATVCKEDE